MKNFFNLLPNYNCVVIHSDLLFLGKKILLNKNFLKKKILSRFKRGIFIPSFNLNNKKTIRFDMYENSMGGLTNLFIKDKKFNRLINPVHSYIYSNIKLNKNEYKNCSFGSRSIFNLFYKKNFIWINLGAGNNSGFTIFHHVECLSNVNYRKKIKFKRYIYYKRKKININYNYFARKGNIIYDFNKPVNEMIKEKILHRFKYNNKSIVFGECKKIIDFLILKLSKNKNYLRK